MQFKGTEMTKVSTVSHRTAPVLTASLRYKFRTYLSKRTIRVSTLVSSLKIGNKILQLNATSETSEVWSADLQWSVKLPVEQLGFQKQ
jgi:hypothetical protein